MSTETLGPCIYYMEGIGPETMNMFNSSRSASTLELGRISLFSAGLFELEPSKYLLLECLLAFELFGEGFSAGKYIF